ncbi:MAG: heme ABC transporter ATP-binding protein [Verrucomicrobiota bacterium]|nr:heme ABC transporter ATP-binding protein [Verrucomicrobiota bacterium]
MLTVEQLTVRRGTRTLVDAVSFGVPVGSFTVVLGPNGAGKSTLFRALAGEFAPEGGQISIHGRALPAWKREELAQFRAVLPQESTLQFPFTVEEVVLLGRTPFSDGSTSAKDMTLAHAALAQMEMSAFANRLYPTLSGGEKQRVQLARVLAQIATPPAEYAPILLLDEPVASLDPAHRFAALEAAKAVSTAGGIVLCIVHDLNLALRYADHLLALRDGKLLASGKVSDTLTPALVEALFDVQACAIPASKDFPGHLVLAPK